MRLIIIKSVKTDQCQKNAAARGIRSHIIYFITSLTNGNAYEKMIENELLYYNIQLYVENPFFHKREN